MDERKPTEVIREAADWCIECPGRDKRSAYLRDMLIGAAGHYALYENRGWPQSKLDAHISDWCRSALALANEILVMKAEDMAALGIGQETHDVR
jgi:hypothetical protein